MMTRTIMMKNRQRGITLLETVGAIAVATLMLIGLTEMIDSSVDDVRGQQVALYQAQVVNAASRYINITDNYDALVASTGGGNLATITIAELKTAGFLPNSFADTNAFNQSTCVLVRQPSEKKLDALVVTYGGTAIPERDVPIVAMLAGQGGGYISAAHPETALGASWMLDTTAYRNAPCGGAGAVVLTANNTDVGGHLVSNLFFDGSGNSSTDFLYRSEVAGREDLNQMNVPLKMDGDAATVVKGNDCGSKAAIAFDANRDLLVCDRDGKWQRVTTWKSPAGSYSDLVANYTSDTPGDVRLEKANGRAYMYDGSGWKALALDDSGNLSAEGTLSAARVAASMEITTDGAIAAKGNITTDSAIAAVGNIASGETINGNKVQANYVLANWWLEGQSLYISETVSAGDPCHIADGSGEIKWARGTVKPDVNGLLLSCSWGDVFRYQNGTLSP